MRTHRCEKSIKARVSIRYTFDNEFMRSNKDYEAWRLFHYILDYDYDTLIQYHISIIEHCPYCGNKLETEEVIKNEQHRGN